jgi:secondary thiamine-phosphate synthase enzyme
VKRETISVKTGHERGLFDITDQCAAFVQGEGDGLLTILVPHATAGVMVMELGAGSEVDLMATLDRLLPRDDRWRHRHGSAGHGADHVLPLFAPPSLSLPVFDGGLQLGTWQSIAVLDPNTDNATREVLLTFIGG